MSMLFFQDFSFFLPDLYFLFSIVTIFSFGTFLSLFCSRLNPPRFSSVFAHLSVFSLFFVALLLLGAFNFLHFSLFNDVYVDTVFSIFSKFLIVLFSLAYLIFSSSTYFKDGFYTFEFPFLFLLAVFSMFFMVSSNDFLLFYLALELQSFCFYILASYRRFVISSVEAGLKYFMLGGLSSSILLFGVSLIYGFSGTTNFSSLSLLFGLQFSEYTVVSSAGFSIGLILFISGLLFKLSFFPFQFWVPDVYAGSPLSVTIFLSTLGKLAPFIFFLRFFYTVFSLEVSAIYPALILFSLGSIFVGSFAALHQTHIKRFFAYTSIAHVGYMGIALCFDYYAFLFYLVSYIFTSLAFFSSFLSLRSVFSGQKPAFIFELSSLFSTNTHLSFFFIFNFFSMAGIPPLIGFFAKFYVISSSFFFGFYLVGTVAVFLSVVSTFYYLKLVRIIFFDNFFTFSFYYPIPYWSFFFTVLFSTFPLFFVIWPDLFLFVLDSVSTFLIFRLKPM